MAASPNIVSRGDAMIFTQSEATAAQRTWPFYLSNSADGTPATGKTIAGADFRISKAGGAFANAAGVVTELSLGWYNMVFAAADLDTVGALACELSGEAGVDTLHVVHQVTVLDLNTATVNPGADGITSATLAASAGTELAAAVDAGTTGTSVANLLVQTAPSRTTGPHSMGSRTTDGAFTPLSTVHAVDCDITVTGTWNGATATPQVCADVTATVPVWVTYGASTLTANGTLRVSGPHPGVRIALTGSGGATSLAAAATMRSNT
jgi:hypothetical protein